MSNARAARRREAKAGVITAPGGATIELSNPVAHHFPAFIVGNAKYAKHVVTPDSAKGQHVVICGAGPSLGETAADYCATADQVWGCNSALIWLADHGHRVTHGFTVDQTTHMVAEWYKAPDVEYLVASTVHPHLTEYLASKGRRLRFFHNFVGIKRPPVEYAICSDCGSVIEDGFPQEECPHGERAAQWTAWLAARPKTLTIPLIEESKAVAASYGFLYNVMPFENWSYAAQYPPTMVAGSGLNATTRAIDVALVMGFDRITVLGADGALRVKSEPPPNAEPNSPAMLDWLRNETVMHADGGNALASGATATTMGAWIDDGTVDDEIRPGHGKYWHTKPDMMITAVWLLKMQRFWGDRLEIVGDTLTNALRNKNQAYLDRLPSMTDSTGKPMKIDIVAPT